MKPFVGKLSGGPDVGGWLMWCPTCGLRLHVTSWPTAMRVANRHAAEARYYTCGPPAHPRPPLAAAPPDSETRT